MRGAILFTVRLLACVRNPGRDGDSSRALRGSNRSEEVEPVS